MAILCVCIFVCNVLVKLYTVFFKVEVLGVLDKEAKMVRLRAIEPMQEGDRNLKRRFAKILEPLALWVHPGSTILTDFSIDKATLHSIGFNNVYQVCISKSKTIIK